MSCSFWFYLQEEVDGNNEVKGNDLQTGWSCRQYSALSLFKLNSQGKSTSVCIRAFHSRLVEATRTSQSQHNRVGRVGKYF